MGNVNDGSHNEQQPGPRFRTEWDVTCTEMDGVRVAAVLPVVPEDADPEVREAIARRRVVMLEGRCPCGAVRQLPNRAMRRAAKRKGTVPRMNATIVHETDCVASDTNLYRLGFVGFGE